MDADKDVDSDRLRDTLIALAPVIGWAFAGLSFGVLILTFPGRHSHVVLVPSLIPVFGVPFAICFAALQVATLAMMRSYKGLAETVGVMLLGAGAAWIGMNWMLGYRDVSALGFTTARHVVTSGAVVGGLFMGVGFIREWLP